MAAAIPVQSVSTPSKSGLNWTSSLQILPKLNLNDVELFVAGKKSPESGLTKSYKFFCEGFIHEFKGKYKCFAPTRLSSFQGFFFLSGLLYIYIYKSSIRLQRWS
jgi:hypothetical protein